jgi:hypothetical protein
MVKLYNTLFFIALAAGPALTLAKEHTHAHAHTPAHTHSHTHSHTHAVESRDVQSQFADLTERSPIFRKLFRMGRRLIGRDLDSSDLTERSVDLGEDESILARELEELEELSTRSPIFRKLFRMGRRLIGRDLDGSELTERSVDLGEDESILARELEELEELSTRSPIFRKLFRMGRRLIGRDLDGSELTERDLADIEDLRQRAVEELSERDFEELAQRSPGIFGKIFGGVRRIFGRDGLEDFEDLTERDLEELFGREEDLEDLYSRDLELEDILEREYGFGELDELD